MTTEKMRLDREGKLEVQRFSLLRRTEHWVAAFSFILLMVTGFPQKLPHWELGHGILVLFGGLDNARFVHRVTGIIFCVHAVLHLGAWMVGAIRGRMRMTMIPEPQDVLDAYANVRYYLGLSTDHPPLPKFDYRQKFEYMGMVLGGLVMMFSGLILLYPVAVVEYLPGFLIPVAKVFHSSEAVLALSVLVVWHVYGASLSPDVFPMDKTMFTGFQPIDHLKHHHAREYEELFPNGEASEAEVVERLRAERAESAES